MEIIEIVLTVIGALLCLNSFFGGAAVNLGRISTSGGYDTAHLNEFINPFEAWLYGFFSLLLSDRRDPRAQDITELKRQIRQLGGNTSEEGEAELKRLKAELTDVRRQSVEAIREERRIDDLAKYRLIETDIANERILREKNARDIAESNREAFNTKRQAYELE